MSNALILAKSGEALKAGPIGLAVILLLCIACYFLFKSMSKHLKTVRDDFPAEPPRNAPPPTRDLGAARSITSPRNESRTEAGEPAEPSALPGTTGNTEQEDGD